MNSDRPLSARTALVTGGTRGIGAASARALAALGASVVATYRNDRAAAEDVAARIRTEHDVAVHAVPFDLTASGAEPGSAGELLDAVARLVDDVDVLVVNAAAPYPKVPLLGLSADQLVGKVGQDVGALHQLVTAFAPNMLTRGYGRIILIGSLHALGPTAPGMAASGVTKAAMAAYVEYAVDELTGPGVTINVIHPGLVATDASSQVAAEVSSMISGLTPAGRIGTPEDVAGVVAMLVRDEATFLNGTSVPVAGGLNHPVALRRVASTKDDTL